ncbi:amino acid deaminase [Rhodococcus sp. 05-2254-5]|uniref:alanine racemase n=1 Tax=unclassified Rhodococcus (in: high G+C Gram-positive bacteria) TaxID=192944 RepID=UPI000B9C554C|nr:MULTISPECIES: alanine racemase [unclassified Rhodococcus (in: high G+C Gram-positive bacteria)]OZE26869.1 amino acid deaminase [Rhodococcus sp. 05-2254-5]OZE58211.1 amino acid deaminase [Rhodococcus sp. 05-2254-1]
MIDTAGVEALSRRLLGPEHKSLPARSWGQSAESFLATAPRLSEFTTPVLTLDRTRIASNVDVMAQWTEKAGVLLAPHGKTTMAPQLWKQQLDAGCWAITLATGWQVQVARAFGVERIVLANAEVDPVALNWVAAELDSHPEFEFYCWADSVATVREMNRILADHGDRPVSVVVELGGEHGRTGARTTEEAVAVGRQIAASPRLELAGVGGYEGALSHDRSDAGLAAVRTYLDTLAALHRTFDAEGLYGDHAIVTAGGSAYQDLVVERLHSLTSGNGVRTDVVLRSGAYVAHDDGFYSQISPLTPARTETPLVSAMHGWARVVSRPEPGLALLDAGKRDFPFDEGMPVPQRVRGNEVLDPAAEVTALNDQHAFLRLPADDAGALPVGAVLRLGLSHPCTAFDKWRLIPVVDDSDSDDPLVVDLIHTFF